MIVGGKHYRTVWMEDGMVWMIDQTKLPFKFSIYKCRTHRESCEAIKTMIVRGAGAVGATAGYAMAQAISEGVNHNDPEAYILQAKKCIEATRPTAADLFMATSKVFAKSGLSPETAFITAQQWADDNAEAGRKIGEYGKTLFQKKNRIATHCNAGWLGLVDYGSALAPVYAAKREGKEVFVFVDETRPRNQGAKLTAWELRNEGIEHRIIADNALAYFIKKEEVDFIITGADRVAANGDVANKIGTFEKAIIAATFNIPFYVAAPLSTFDLTCKTGDDILIEEREEEEITYVSGMDNKGKIVKLRIASPGSHAVNPAFDITPAHYITGIITPEGIYKPGDEKLNKTIYENRLLW